MDKIKDGWDTNDDIDVDTSESTRYLDKDYLKFNSNNYSNNITENKVATVIESEKKDKYNFFKNISSQKNKKKVINPIQNFKKKNTIDITCNYGSCKSEVKDNLSRLTTNVIDVKTSLHRYLYSLSHPSLLHITNSILESQCNTKEAALELCKYCELRPNLAEYTIYTEVPRMDYKVLLDNGIILDRTEDIQSFFSQKINNNVDENQSKEGQINSNNTCTWDSIDEILLRCSNQSLLADALTVLSTESDEKEGRHIICTKYSATAIAKRCNFVIDMRKGEGTFRTVKVHCTLAIGIPSGCSSTEKDTLNSDKKIDTISDRSFIKENKCKLNLANIHMIIHFSPEPTRLSLSYKLLQIETFGSIAEYGPELTLAACELEKDVYSRKIYDKVSIMKIGKTSPTPLQTNKRRNNINGCIRDNFLKSLTTAHTVSVEGMKSALSDIDAVTCVTQKLSFLSRGLGNALNLPTTEDLRSVEQEENNLSLKLTYKKQINHKQPPSNINRLISNDSPYYEDDNTKHYFTSNLPSAIPLHCQDSENPKPVIGKYIISGLNKLARVANISSVISNESSIVVTKNTISSIYSRGYKDTLSKISYDSITNVNELNVTNEYKENHRSKKYHYANRDKKVNKEEKEQSVFLENKNSLLMNYNNGHTINQDSISNTKVNSLKINYDKSLNEFNYNNIDIISCTYKKSIDFDNSKNSNNLIDTNYNKSLTEKKKLNQENMTNLQNREFITLSNYKCDVDNIIIPTRNRFVSSSERMRVNVTYD